MRIALIVCYFGEWPVWFPAHLHSCRSNPDVDWLILTDIPAPPNAPPNVRFFQCSLQELQERAGEALGFPVILNRPYKLCDLRPAFGIVFQELLRGYDFWGHTDIDIVWGDIRAFMTDSILDEHDILSARKNNICGHFSLFRNTTAVNTLFREDSRFSEYMMQDRPFYYDEVGMTKLVNKHREARSLEVFWPRYLVNFANSERIPRKGPSYLGKLSDNWLWRHGKLFECGTGESEVMYLHFMTWKHSLRHCEVDYRTDPDQFYVSYSHIRLEKRGKRVFKIPELIRWGR